MAYLLKKPQSLLNRLPFSSYVLNVSRHCFLCTNHVSSFQCSTLSLPSPGGMSKTKQIEAFSRCLPSSTSAALLYQRIHIPPSDACISLSFLPHCYISRCNRPMLSPAMHVVHLNEESSYRRYFCTGTSPFTATENRFANRTVAQVRSPGAYIPFDQEAAEERHRQNVNSEALHKKRILLGAGCFAFAIYFISQLKEVDFWFYSLATEVMCRWVDPETAHNWVIWLAGHDLLPLDVYKDDSAMRVTIKGLEFPNPIGLAAGFDKNAKGPLSFLKMGFGFVEIGTVTPLPQEGNPKPRIFRLREDRAVINRCGFNGEGVDVVEKRLKHISKERWKNNLTLRNIIGVNVGKNKTTQIAADDIQYALDHLGRYGDYVVINVSSPNTPGLRDLQAKAALTQLVETAQASLTALESSHKSTQFPSSSPSSPPSTSPPSSSTSSPSSSPPSTSPPSSSTSPSPSISPPSSSTSPPSSSTSSPSSSPPSSSTSSSPPSSSTSSSPSTSSPPSSSTSPLPSTSPPPSTSPLHQPKIYTRTIIDDETSQKKYFYEEETQKIHSFSNFPNQQRGRPLLFIKVAPDLTYEQKKDIADVISRPSILSNSLKEETGGLSGAPLKELSTACVEDFYKLTNGNIAIIACGGVETGEDALEKVEAGASLIQIYTSMIYGGPSTVRRIKNELSYLLYKKGYHSLESAVGQKFKKKTQFIKAPTFD